MANSSTAGSAPQTDAAAPVGPGEPRLSGRSVLVIGYGNELRGDDAAGLRVAEAIEAMRLPGVEVIACHQLTFDLAGPMSGVAHVIFADARPLATGDGGALVPEIFEVPVGADAGITHHHSSPTSLVALTRAVFGRCPRATCVAVPAVNFDLGFQISPVAEQGIQDAVAAIQRLVGDSHGWRRG